MKKGLVHVYYGNGKGKTSASVGLAVRAVGNGNRVLMIQCLKARPSGEISALKDLPGVTIVREDCSEKFIWDLSDAEIEQAKQRDNDMLDRAWNDVAEGKYDVLILDEVLDSVHGGLIDEETFLGKIAARPATLEVVLTGHHVSQAIIDAADYVTEMKKIKHPFDSGIKARKGVEF